MEDLCKVSPLVRKGKIMIAFQNTRYSELENTTVTDSDGVKIGRVIDIVFDIEEPFLHPTSIVLGDSPFEEFLERIGAKPDDDPVFCISEIKSMYKKIQLDKTKQEISSKLKDCLLEKTQLTFSKLSDIPVVDSEDIEIGSILDVWFDKTGNVWFIVGGGIMEETLEEIGFLPDIDLLIAPRTIKDITDELIRLRWNLDDIRTTCENATKEDHIFIQG